MCNSRDNGKSTNGTSYKATLEDGNQLCEELEGLPRGRKNSKLRLLTWENSTSKSPRASSLPLET
ncbi:hypothetical protein PanWU01x14_101250 [Parasponia andersonii]|uniref:Uncharacterized protein n=1 Tax=Parasponia andersonii TaxID=3476 RepID=A0A2P5D329_PARAD|nr:hypothetical protein PanWU01x14_101250 [Parasponia andersonii]